MIPGSERFTGEGIGCPLQYSWASLVAQLVKNLPTMWETGFNLWVGKIPWRRERLPTPVFWPENSMDYSPWYFPGGSDSKVFAYNAGDLGSILGLGRSPGEGNGYPLQNSCLENSKNRGASRRWAMYSGKSGEAKDHALFGKPE